MSNSRPITPKEQLLIRLDAELERLLRDQNSNPNYYRGMVARGLTEALRWLVIAPESAFETKESEKP